MAEGLAAAFTVRAPQTDITSTSPRDAGRALARPGEATRRASVPPASVEAIALAGHQALVSPDSNPSAKISAPGVFWMLKLDISVPCEPSLLQTMA